MYWTWSGLLMVLFSSLDQSITRESYETSIKGVAWDPLNKYAASLSSDRTCRIYVKKPQSKTKGSERTDYVCQHVLTKVESQVVEETKSAKHHLFHDETLPSFFRRLSWSHDGSFLLVPAGSYKLSPTSEPVNTAYVMSRKDLSRPALMLPGASKAVVAVRFCPKAFGLRGLSTSSSFKLPYRLVFAVATLNSLYVARGINSCYNTVVIATGIHAFFGKAAHLVDSTNQVCHFRKDLTAIGNFCICSTTIGLIIEIAVMRPIQ